MKDAEKIERQLKKLRYEQSEDSRKRVLGNVTDVLERQRQNRPATGSAVWRIIMNNRITKLAAAAVIIIAVMAGVHFIGGSIDVASSALGSVVKNVEQAKTVSFRLSTVMTGMPDSEIMVYDSSEYGSRIDAYIGGEIAIRIYGPRDENVIITVIPKAKIWRRMTFTEDQREQMAQREKDPREFVRLFLSVEHAELGRRMIGGKEAEGLEVDSPKVGGGMFESAIGRLWFDIETNLPVLMEIEGLSEGGAVQTNIIMDNFKWNRELAASEFEPDIGEGYILQEEVKMPEGDANTAAEGLNVQTGANANELLEAALKRSGEKLPADKRGKVLRMLSLSEKDLLKGLGVWLELLDGRYPDSLDTKAVLTQADRLISEKYGITKGGDKETQEEMEGRVEDIFFASAFHDKLVREHKNVAYYGQQTAVKDGGKVLMRWKEGKDTYRVIFGNLEAKTVTKQELAELEKRLLD